MQLLDDCNPKKGSADCSGICMVREELPQNPEEEPYAKETIN